jgi:hypothetical protein
MGFNMNRLLIVAILIIGILPLYAQSQQPDAAELAQKVVGIVGGDKTKTQTYCQVLDLSDELDQVDRQKDREKAEDLSRKINELQKTLGPEYLALLEAAKYVDPNSKDGQEIVSIFDKLDDVRIKPSSRERASPTKCGKNIVVACWANTDWCRLIRTDRS